MSSITDPFIRQNYSNSYSYRKPDDVDLFIRATLISRSTLHYVLYTMEKYNKDQVFAYVYEEVIRGHGSFDLTSDEPLIIPSGVTIIADYFLTACYELKHPPIIPETVTSIGDGFLMRCISLKEPPKLPTSIKKIGDSFLEGCTSLRRGPHLFRGNKFTTLGRNFMKDCTATVIPPRIPLTGMFGCGFMEGCTEIDRIFRVDVKNRRKRRYIDGDKFRPVRSSLYVCYEYWKREDRKRVLSYILDLPQHIYE